MIPILYKKSDTNYTRNGAGRLVDVLSCSVTEERNGAYECVFTYPISGRLYSEIAEGDVIKAKANETSALQIFRIYAHSKPINGIVTFNAEHISYDANGIPLAGFSASATTPQAAITRAISEGAFVSSFTAWSDISSLNNINISEPCSLRALLGGQQGSVLDVWGGEYEFDNYVIKLHQHRGADNGVTIEYGKNLTDVTQERNITETYTHIMPYATYTSETDGDITVTLTEKVLPLAIAENVGHQKALIVNFTDKFSENEPITEQALRLKATAFVQNSKLGTPKVNIKASFVSLWQTEEYKSIAPLERVRLCDTVTVRFVKLGVSAKAKVIKTVYDTVAERYISVEIGDVRSSFADTVLEQNKAIAELAEVVRKGFSDATAEIQEAIAEATAAITGNSGGYIVLYPSEHPQEILIMDSPSIETAVHVWRWNASGLGYSSTGYNGTYGLAMTMNGAIVADFITAGTINGGLLQADSVQANAISVGFKQSITDSINLAKTTVEQEFKLADAELSSTIYESIASYNETGYTVDARGLGSPGNDTIAFWCEELGRNSLNYLNLLTGELWGVSRRWNEQTEEWDYGTTYPPTQLQINSNCIQSQILQQGNEITAVVSSLQSNYYTKIETDSRITVSKDSVLLTVSSAQSKYDEKNYTVNYYGYGTPSAAGYDASGNSGKYYLDQTSGDLYLSDGSAWAKVETLQLITQKLQSSITANTNAIALKVSKGDVVSEINISHDTISLTSGRLIITSGNFQLDSSGNATLANATFTGGTITSSNYVSGTGGMSINLATGAISTISGKFQLSSGGVITAESATLTSATVTGTITTISGDYKTILSSGRLQCYYNNDHTGNVGGSYWTDDSTKRGMAFQLDAGGYYMAWSAKDSGGGNSYTTIMTYVRGAIGNNFSEGEGLYVSENLFVNAPSRLRSLTISNGYSISWGGYASALHYSSSDGLVLGNSSVANTNTTISAGQYVKLNAGGDSGFIHTYSTLVLHSETIGITTAYDSNTYLSVLAYDRTNDRIKVGNSNKPLYLWGSTVYVNGTAYSGGADVSGGFTLNDDAAISFTSISNAICYHLGSQQGSSNKIVRINSDLQVWENIEVVGGAIFMQSTSVLSSVQSGICAVGHGSLSYLNLNGQNIRASSEIVVVSDERQKREVEPLAEKYIKMLKTIDPVSFKYNNGIDKSERRHTGFIAQDVLQAMIAAGIETAEFAAFVDLYNDGKEYGLRYGEFISPLLAYVQHLEGRVAALERTG